MPRTNSFLDAFLDATQIVNSNETIVVGWVEGRVSQIGVEKLSSY
jgi:hypothetical protein